MTLLGGRLSPLMITCLLALPALAQQNIPLTLAEAEDLALDQEPGHEALLQQSLALAEEAMAAGSDMRRFE